MVAGRTRLAHRLGYELQRGPVPEGLCVLHKCDNPACVRGEHLFVGTRGDNARDMTAKGRNFLSPAIGRRGEQHHNTTLTQEQVEEIRALYKTGGISQRELGVQFGTTQATVSNIVRRVTW